jgi:cytochrome P450
VRKDGDAHMSERKAIFPAISPKTVRSHRTAQFKAHADRILDTLDPARLVAGAFASRAMVADVALPAIFSRLRNLRMREGEPVRIGGWAFRGLLNLPVTWDE